MVGLNVTKGDLLYHQAIEKWGPDAQVLIFFEEFAEAIQAVAKHGRNLNGSTIKKIADELADAQIMLEQMIIVFDCGYEFQEAIKNKLIRLKERIDDFA